MQNKGLLLGLGVLLFVAAIAIFLVTSGRGSRSVSSPVASTVAVAQSPIASSANDSTESADTLDNTREVVVSGNEYSFMPASIDLKSGEEVRVVFKNTGKLPHDLVVDELNARTKVIGGDKEDVIILKATKSGNYSFYCSVGNHRQLGMEGKMMIK